VQLGFIPALTGMANKLETLGDEIAPLVNLP